MRLIDTLSIAFKNLWRRKLRAFLTVLGMVIGTSSIVIMVSLGIGINEYFKESIERTGSMTTITVTNYRMEKTAQAGSAMVSVNSSYQEIILDNKAVDNIRKIIGVTSVMPMLQTYGEIKSGQYSTSMSIMGVDINEAENFGFVFSEGKLPGPHKGSSYEVVFSPRILQSFYNMRNGKQAIDSSGNPRIKMTSRFQLTFDWRNIYDSGSSWEGDSQPKGKMYNLKPVGILAEEGNNYAWYCLMDINAVKKLAKENKDFMGLNTDRYSQILVKCANTDDVLDIQKQIIDLGYGAESAQDTLKMVTDQFASLRMLLGAIGGVSLLVAAIGIMNTMMMSIYERTKEIGIIKVLGCRMINISGQFLTEAAYIGLFGGAIGLVVSYGVSFALNKLVFLTDGNMMGMTSMMRSVIPLYLSAGAVVFSILVALISGMYPAIRAMRLSALNAIRNE